MITKSLWKNFKEVKLVKNYSIWRNKSTQDELNGKVWYK